MNMDEAALDLQLSRIISAVEQTTIFTTIVPKPTAKADYTETTAAPAVTVTQESERDNGASGLPGGKIFGALEIIIALSVLAGVLFLVMGIILCDRRRRSKRKRAAERAQKRMTEKSEVEGHQPPSGARLPEGIWPRMADKNQTVHDYWHNEASRQQQQGWVPGQQPGVQPGLPRYG